MRISIKEFARRKQVSYRAIHAAVESGKITKGEDNLIDWEDGCRELAENSTLADGEILDEEAVKNPLTFAAARTKNEILKSEVNEIKIQQLNNELVEKQEAMRVFYLKTREFRDALQNWPARVASQIASELETDPHTTNVVLERFVHKFLEDLSVEKVDLVPSNKQISTA